MMDTTHNTLHNLFDQLGLPSSDEGIERFVKKHSPLPKDVVLSNAAFWNDGQRSFLREAICDDSDWAEVVDQLNVLLRGS